jgi:signal transduction histidine kinase
MSMTTPTPRRVFEFPDEYAAALRDYLRRNDEAALRRTYELGRQAIAAKLGVLDLAKVHHDAFVRVSGRLAAGARAETMNAATRFFVECLTPFELTHSGFTEVTAALRPNEERARERMLDAVNPRLEEEARRIAHALHDEAAQLLASVYLALDTLGDLSPDVHVRLAEARTLLEQVDEQLRRLSHELRPTTLTISG